MTKEEKNYLFFLGTKTLAILDSFAKKCKKSKDWTKKKGSFFPKAGHWAADTKALFIMHQNI